MVHGRRTGRRSFGHAGRALPVVLASAMVFSLSGGVARAAKAPEITWTKGKPWTGDNGKVVSVRELQIAALVDRQELELEEHEKNIVKPDRTKLPQHPNAPMVASWPPLPGSSAAAADDESASQAPQSVGSVFLGATFAETSPQGWPPDTMGDVGPTQFIVAINGLIRSFNKNTGVADGVLNVGSNTFWNSVRGSFGTTDPRIRFDRLSNRWILIWDQAAPSSNRIMLAVSSGPVITNQSNFTFYFFQHDTVTPVGDAGCFADYPTLGVDAHALYIGVNQFCPQTYGGSSVFVVRKSSIMSGGPIVVTAFRQVTLPVGAGPFTPQGVDNLYDPNPSHGYFIGVDNASFSLLQVRAISDPGGTPSISSNIPVAVPATTSPMDVPHSDGADANDLDSLDDRLFQAYMRNGRIWTAHNIEVGNTGTANASGNRNGSRWYEIAASGTSVGLVQSGTLFDPASANPRSYWIPAVAVSGQGHMALGSSVAAPNTFVDAATAGRLRTDAVGVTGAPITYTNSTAPYSPSNLGTFVNRWGDYSYTTVDPDDDMTMWTIQEAVASQDTYGVYVAKLNAPPPASVASVTPSTVAGGEPSVTVTVNGTSTNGSGFFDPGAGFAKRLAAAVSGGVTVNSVTYNSPTSVTLDLNTTGAPAGAKSVTITNPDGQQATGASALTVTSGGGSTPAISVAPPALSFGSVQVGATAPAQTVTVTSIGTADASISGVSLAGANAADFAISSDTCAGATLPPTQQCTVGVTFSPTTGGARSASLQITSNTSGSPNIVSLGGTGIVPPPPAPPGWQQFHGNAQRTGLGPAARMNAAHVIQTVDAAGVITETPLLADLDADGDLDVVATSNSNEANAPSIVRAYRQTPTGLALMWSFSTPSTQANWTNGWATLAIGDLDGDQTPEVVVYSNTQTNTPAVTSTPPDGHITVLRAADGSVVAQMGPTSLAIANRSMPAIGDVDGDGRAEIVVARQVGGTGAAAGGYITTVQLNGSALAKEADLRLGANVLGNGPVLGELRGAHAGLEVVVAEDSANANQTLWLCTPSGTAPNCNESVTVARGTRGLAIGDLSGDATPEIVANGRTNQSLSVIRTTPSLAVLSTATDYIWGTSSLGDVDGDGRAEIVNVMYSEFVDDVGRFGDVLVHGYTGNSVQAEGSLERTPGPGENAQSPGGGALLDLTGDLRPELVFGSNDGTLNAVRFSTSSVPSMLWSLPLAGVASPPALGDVNGDGNTDIVVGGSDGRLHVVGNRPPTLATIGNKTVNAGSTLAFGVSANDDDDETITYSSPNLPDGATLNATTGAFSWSPSVSQAGTYEAVKIQVTDGSSTVFEEITITVTAGALSLSRTSVDFGSRAIGATSPAESVTLTNTGDGSLAVGTISIGGANGGDFALAADSCSGAVVPAAGTCSFSTTFTPSAAGPRAGTVSVPSSGAGSPQVVGLSGSGFVNAAVTHVSPSSLSFGSTQVGAQSAPQTVTIRNDGGIALTVGTPVVTGANAGDFEIVADSCAGASVAPSATCTIDLRFTPSMAGLRSASLEIPSNAAGGPDVVSLSGTGIVLVPRAAVSPSSVTFPEQESGTSGPPTPVTVRNDGLGSLEIASVTVIGTNAGDFPLAADACTGASLAAGASCQVSVRFAPTDVGERRASLQVASNDPSSPATVTLRGISGPVRGRLTFSPAGVPFGSVPAGTMSAPVEVTVTNAGPAQAEIIDLTLTGVDAVRFSLDAGTCSSTVLGSGTSCSFTVRFAPTVWGPRSAAVRVDSDAAGSPHLVALSGTGSAPALRVSPGSVDYGDLAVGSSATAALAIRNDGDRPLSVGALALAGSDAASFAVTANPCSGVTLGTGGSCTVSVRFSASSAGSFAASLGIASNDPAGSASVGLLARGRTDSTVPTSGWDTREGSVLFGGLSSVHGHAADDLSGIASVAVTFQPASGAPTVSDAVLSCDASGRRCTFRAAVPVAPGYYTVFSRATDQAGNTQPFAASIYVYVI